MMIVRCFLLCLCLAFATNYAGAQDIVIADFEHWDYGAWKVEGDAFGKGSSIATHLQVTGYRGKRVINSFGGADRATGSLTSPEFSIERPYVCFLVGGGKHENETGAELLIEGKRVRSATGHDSPQLRWVSWNVSEFKGKKAAFRIFDSAKGAWGHISVDHVIQSEKPRTGSGNWRLEEYRQSADYYKEMFRPAYHFTPELNWMNDPNGLVYFDGEYHLFYQHNPLGNDWGHMSWGHAVSKDLFHWEHLPIALQDQYDVMAFSGSAIVDENNSSGFGDGKTPPLVAIYTGHGGDRQTQDLAYSHDRGRTWKRYAGNPVLDIGEKDFRDPKVFWHEPTKRWIMVVALATAKKIQLYASPNLKSWTYLSEFGPAGAKEKLNWECPDLFELSIANEPGQSRWVLHIGMGNGSVAGGSGGEYFTGTFDGATFTADSLESQWTDYGRDFYASVSWSDIPNSDGRRIWIGWMNNWETCLNPTWPWRSAMSAPRELSLRRIEGKLRLCQTPVREIEKLYSETSKFWTDSIENDISILQVPTKHYELKLEFTPGDGKEFGVHLFKSKDGKQKTTVAYDVGAKEIYVDRTKSGNVDFHRAFAGKHSAPLSPDADGKIRMRILVDACSVEVFGNDGEAVITDLIFPEGDQLEVEVFAKGCKCDLTLNELRWARCKPATN
jgi:fructan beta-fructosidase